MEKKISKKKDQSSVDVNRSHEEEGEASASVAVPRVSLLSCVLKALIPCVVNTHMSKCSCIVEHICVEARG